MSLMLKFSWEVLFFKSGDTGVVKADRNKLFASDKRQINNHTLMLDINFTHTCQLCVPSIVEVSLKRFFFTQGNLQGGRVEDHRMFT